MVRAGSGARCHHLQGDLAIQEELLGFVDDPHAPAAQLAQDSKSPRRGPGAIVEEDVDDGGGFLGSWIRAERRASLSVHVSQESMWLFPAVICSDDVEPSRYDANSWSDRHVAMRGHRATRMVSVP